MNSRIFATLVVFIVITAQTFVVNIQYDFNQDKAGIFIGGFFIADILSICAWYLFKDEK